MRKITVAILFLIINSIGIAQEQDIVDTLVFPNEITYHSDLEREAFYEFFNDNQENYIKLFFAKDPSLTKEEYLNKYAALEQYISTLKNDKNFNKQEKKKVKYYYNKIHNKYLSKYELNTFFPQIFKNGYYNCATGTILFSLIFDELNIPYTIKVSPIHAYIVAYPSTESIIVETTNPIKGYFTFNQTFKDNYVKHLRDNKMISTQEYNSSSVDVLFDKYYFKEKDISLKEMVGIQYYNDAIEKIQNQNLEDAFYELEKAYLFYPSDDIEYLLYYTAAYVIEKQDYSDIKYVNFLYKIARYKKFGINQQQIIGEFGRITQTQMEYKGRYELYDTIYSRLNKNLTDEQVKKEITFIYNYEKARLFIRNEKIEEALPHVKEALKIRPEHLDLQTLFVYVLTKKYGGINLTDDILKNLYQYGEEYPVLKENNNYLNMLSDAIVFMAVQNYENKNIKKALKYQEMFNEIGTNEYLDYEYNISRLYSAAAVYYFRIGNMKKSKSIILRGLELAPNSYELKQRLKTFN